MQYQNINECESDATFSDSEHDSFDDDLDENLDENLLELINMTDLNYCQKKIKQKFH